MIGGKNERVGGGGEDEKGGRGQEGGRIKGWEDELINIISAKVCQ